MPAYELGGLRRKRKIKDAETLLRVLLMHAAAGTSLRTTVAYAREAGFLTKYSGHFEHPYVRSFGVPPR